jgi:hypothetical protein
MQMSVEKRRGSVSKLINTLGGLGASPAYIYIQETSVTKKRSDMSLISRKPTIMKQERRKGYYIYVVNRARQCPRPMPEAEHSDARELNARRPIAREDRTPEKTECPRRPSARDIRVRKRTEQSVY